MNIGFNELEMMAAMFEYCMCVSGEYHKCSHRIRTSYASSSGPTEPIWGWRGQFQESGLRRTQSLFCNTVVPGTISAWKTVEHITSFGWTVLPHIPYSLNLVSSDFHLFRPINDGLHGQHFTSNYAIISTVKRGHMQWNRFLQGWHAGSCSSLVITHRIIELLRLEKTLMAKILMAVPMLKNGVL